MCCSELSVGSGFCGVHDMAVSVDGASVVDMTGVVDLTAGVAGKDVDVVEVRSMVMGI